MTTTTIPPYRFEQNGHAFNGEPKWDVYSTVNGAHLGFTAKANSKRNGTIWMAAFPDGKRVGHGYRNREAAALALEAADDAQA